MYHVSTCIMLPLEHNSEIFGNNSEILENINEIHEVYQKVRIEAEEVLPGTN